MDTYKFRVVLEVEVDAFDVSDASAAVEETFGVGNDCGVEVVSSSYSLVGSE